MVGQRVGGGDCGTARVRDHRYPSPTRRGRGRQGQNKVEKFFESAGTQHAGLPEEGIHGGVAGRERAGVRGGSPLAGRRAPAFEHHDRLGTAHPLGKCEEALGFGQRLQVQHDHPRRVVAFPDLEQVVDVHVGAIAERHEVREAKPHIASRFQHRDA